MSNFDFSGDFPRWEDSDERLYEQRWSDHTKPLEGFNAIVDRLVATRGLDRDEAERIATEIVMDDAA